MGREAWIISVNDTNPSKSRSHYSTSLVGVRNSAGNPNPAGSGDVFLGILPVDKDLIQTNNYYLLEPYATLNMLQVK